MGELLVGWVAFPLLALVVCTGCGLLVRALARDRIEAPLVPVVGYAAVVVVGELLTASGSTAKLTTPVVAALAVLGLALGLRRPTALQPWAFAAAAVAFAVLAAPIVLSGHATIAGFIKLDDTATWLAFTDRVVDHGRDLGGLAPSTYEATLKLNIGEGYPIGVFVPLGIGSKLTGTDPAWLIQPYMASLGALLSLALWSLATPLASSPRLRAAAAATAAVPALLVGYYLWGGVKEIAAAALIAAAAALAVRALAEPERWSRLIAPALSAAALVAVLGAGGTIWLLAILLPAAAVLIIRVGVLAGTLRSAAVAVAVAALALPTLLAGPLRPPTSLPLDDSSAVGNLARPLDPVQLGGIWGTGDFRFAPDHELLTDALIAVACLAAVAGLAWCLRRRELGPPLFVLGTLAGCALIAALGSPWVEGKAYATASVAVPFAAMLGVGWLASTQRPAAAAAVGLAVAGGVAWSNALAYSEVSLAPRDQLAELEQIGDRIAGQGPTLITEYSPYGARHFLRDADPESISELRRRRIELRDGTEVPKGDAADTDRIDPATLAVYRTLVIRRSPAASRPPADYRLIWRGEYYEAWQRGPEPSPALDDLPLGDRFDPVAVPSCAAVRALGRSAAPGSRLVASTIPEPVVATAVPAFPLDAPLNVDRTAEYRVWLEASAMPALTTSIDGEVIGTVRGRLSNRGGYADLGTAHLEAGRHRIQVTVGDPDLHPGSDGPAGTTGHIALATADPADARLIEVDPAEAQRLCGRPLDWVEQVAAGG
jgi:hypothetical protein